jgi:hypothetical protein
MRALLGVLLGGYQMLTGSALGFGVGGSVGAMWGGAEILRWAHCPASAPPTSLLADTHARTCVIAVLSRDVRAPAGSEAPCITSASDTWGSAS